MPTYQYACTACGERTEAVQSFSDAPLTECPVCGGTLRKVFSAVGVVFKGSGFYKNDSRSSSGSTAKKDDGAASTPAKTESAPAASSTPAAPAAKPSSTPAAGS